MFVYYSEKMFGNPREQPTGSYSRWTQWLPTVHV